MEKCKDVMTKDVTCSQAADSVETAAQRMRDENIGTVLVCGDFPQKLAGILTDRDIVVKVIAQGRDPKETTVGEVMTPDPVCCYEEDDLQVAINLMEKHQVGRVPVVAQDDRLVGIISQGDIATRTDHPDKTAEMAREVCQRSQHATA